MLAIGARLAKNDRARIDAFWVSDSTDSDTLAIALHIDLLDMCGKSVQSLAVRQDSSRGVAANMIVVEAKQSHENWNVFSHVSLCDSYLVHRRHAVEELSHVIESIE